MSANVFSVAGLIVAFAASAAPQEQPAWTEIRELSERLRDLGGAQDSTAIAERAGLVAAIGDTVLRGVELELNVGNGAELAGRIAGLAAQLGQAQIASQDWKDAVGAPFVRLVEGPAESTVFASFVALDGGAGAPHSNVWIWALRERNGKLEAVDSAGSDFEGCGLFLQEIPSGRSGQTWLLAWGPVFGANQSPVRVRVYSFDGERFETVWSPPDRFQGKVRIKDGALEASYLDPVQYYERREPPFFRFERYALDVQGLVEVESALTEGPAIP